MKRLSVLALTLFLVLPIALAKSEPPIEILWPAEKPALKLSFDKFRGQGNYAGQNSYLSDVRIENLTGKQIPRVSFTVYFLDKNKVRIGDGALQVADLEAGQTAKMEFQFYSVGVPASLTITPKKDMLAKIVPLKIVSVPPGAKLKVDGHDDGITPVMVRLGVGTHQLELTKEGYAPGVTPLDVTADELPGGSITVELGGLSRDTVELRDGTTLTGDVISLSMAEMVVRIDGKDQKYLRSQVKKLILVERVNDQQPTVVQPLPAPSPQQ